MEPLIFLSYIFLSGGRTDDHCSPRFNQTLNN